MRQQGKLMALIAILALLLPGAVVLAGGAPEADDTIELTFWVQRTEFIPEVGFEPFYEQNPNIRVNVEIVDPADMASQLAMATQARQAPDISMHGSEEVPVLAEAGLIQAIDGYLDRFRRDFPDTYNALGDAAWQAASYQGNTYGIAVSSSPRFIYYRRDWFADAGLPAPPQTTEDVLEAARIFAEQGRYAFALVGDSGMLPLDELAIFRAVGGQYENGVPIIDSEAGRHFIDFYQTMVREGLAHPDILGFQWGDKRALFYGGNAAMMLDGIHMGPTAEQNLSFSDGEWALAKIPHRPGAPDDSTQTSLSNPYLISSSSEHPWEALKVLEYLASTDIVAQQALRYGAYSNEEAYSRPEVLAAAPWIEEVQPLLSAWSERPSGHPEHEGRIVDVFIDLRSDLYSNPNRDPAEVAVEFQQRFNRAAGIR